MPKQKQNETDVQGTEVSRETKTRKPSAMYATKQFGDFIKKMEELKTMDTEEIDTLKSIHRKMIAKYLGYEL